jgi:hypothetical protein
VIVIGDMCFNMCRCTIGPNPINTAKAKTNGIKITVRRNIYVIMRQIINLVESSLHRTILYRNTSESVYAQACAHTLLGVVLCKSVKVHNGILSYLKEESASLEKQVV